MQFIENTGAPLRTKVGVRRRPRKTKSMRNTIGYLFSPIRAKGYSKTDDIELTGRLFTARVIGGDVFERGVYIGYAYLRKQRFSRLGVELDLLDRLIRCAGPGDLYKGIKASKK